jgi:hypothetical protein
MEETKDDSGQQETEEEKQRKAGFLPDRNKLSGKLSGQARLKSAHRKDQHCVRELMMSGSLGGPRPAGEQHDTQSARITN